jgi:membrane associated rhomboid family serine protease
MGIYDRDYYRNEGPSYLDSIFPEGRVCKWLIGINVFLYVAQLLTYPLPQGPGINDGNGLGPVTGWLILDTARVLHGEVWRLLTYAFLHDIHGISHLFFNMLFLWWFGSDIEHIYGSREFLAFYLVSALLGGIAYQAWAMAQGTASYCLGASGAITAVLLLVACHFPSRTILVFFLLPVPIWLFVVFQVGQDVYTLIGPEQGRTLVAASVHLAGAAFAYAYYKRHWRVLDWLPDLRRKISRRQRPSLRVYRPHEEKETVSVAAAKGPSEMDEHFEAKVDAVLEKVARTGQDSLTDNERQILLQASEIYKRKRT